MMGPRKKAGFRVEIVDVLHSPACTRAVGELLIDRRGTVAKVLRGGTPALVELEADWAESPGGVRRRPVEWDDLRLRHAMWRHGSKISKRTAYTQWSRISSPLCLRTCLATLS
jgi:hypothetical protein